MARPRAIVLRAPGTNCDEETAAAWERAGAVVETWHVGRLIESPIALDLFQILTIPGGFSYGDDLGAGRILATRLGTVLGEALRRFHDRGGLILGICNGFQVLVRSGPAPGRISASSRNARSQRIGPVRGPLGPARTAPGASPVRLLAGLRDDRTPRGPWRGRFVMVVSPTSTHWTVPVRSS